MEEQWKDIKGYEGYYKISNLGRILGVKRGKLKKSSFQKNKGKIYGIAPLWKDGVFEILSLPALVYKHFIGDDFKMIDYKDGDYSNCSADNLISVDKSFSFKKSQCKRVLDVENMKVHDSISDLAKYLRVSTNNLSARLKNKSEKYSQYKLID